MKWSALFASGYLALGLAATTAQGLTLDSATASWSNALGGSGIQYNLISGNETQVRWGRSTGYGKSGLGFDGVAPPPQQVFLETEFNIGTLRHFNQPIRSGSAASQVKMTISLDIDFPPIENETFSFNVAVNETPNSTGNNHADRDFITVPYAFADTVFDIAGVDYTLKITGFRLLSDLGGATVGTFESDERANNSVALFGMITAHFPPPPDDVPPIVGIPEPATAATGIMALAGLALTAMRRRRW